MHEESHHRSNNNRGMTLAGTLVSVAIASIVMLTIGSLVSSMFRMSTKTDALAGIDQVTRIVTSIISDPVLCKNALRVAGPAKVTFNPDVVASANVDFIGITRLGSPADQVAVSANPAVAPGNKISERMVLQSITLKEIVPGQGRSSLVQSGITYNLYQTWLILGFQATGAAVLQGGTLPARKIALVVAVGPAGTVDDCLIDDLAIRHATLCNLMGGSWTAATETCTSKFDPRTSCLAHACPLIAPPGCGYTPEVSGFDSTGQPICICMGWCSGGAPPPAPTP